jgi:hypothetical protein
MITLRRRLVGNAYVTYEDQPHTAAAQEDNTNKLAAEFGILPALAAKALDLLFPWDHIPTGG